MVAPSTTITYNNVLINNCLTKRFTQETVYDDSGTDFMYFKYTVRVVGFCHGINSTTGPSMTLVRGSIGSNAVTTCVQLRSQLSEPRQSFLMQIGTQTLLQSDAYDDAADPEAPDLSQIDLCNGPKPKVFDVVQIAGTNVFKVEFEIEICNLECNGSTDLTDDEDEPTAGPVLSNRWSVSDEVDNNFYTTRTFSGRLRIASAAVNANDFRNYVVPKLQPGFRRNRMTFVVTPDGLNLDYTIQDQEIAFSAPSPATSWHMTHTEHAGDAKFQSAEIYIRFDCPRDASKKYLIGMASEIVQNRLLKQQNAAGNNDPNIIDGFSVSDIYGDNENAIEVRASVRRVPNDNQNANNTDGNAAIAMYRTGILGLPLDGVLKDEVGEVIMGPFIPVYGPNYNSLYSADPEKGPGYSPSLVDGKPGPPGVRGPIPIVDAFVCYLQSGCDSGGISAHGIEYDEDEDGGDETNTDSSGDGSGAGVDESNSGDSNTTVSVYQTSLNDLPKISEEPEQASSSQMAAMYTSYTMESKYIIQGNSVSLPIADVTNPSGGSSYPGPGPIQTGDSACTVLFGPQTADRKIRVQAERIGAWPEMPSPDNFTDENEIRYYYRDQKILAQTPDVTPDRQRVFRMDIEYLFSMSRAPNSTDTLRTGINPWSILGGFSDETDNTLPTGFYGGDIFYSSAGDYDTSKESPAVYSGSEDGQEVSE